MPSNIRTTPMAAVKEWATSSAREYG
jgi:hypothetical protein